MTKEGVCDFCGEFKDVNRLNTGQVICADCIKTEVGYSVQNTTKVSDDIMQLAVFSIEGDINPTLKVIMATLGEALRLMILKNNIEPLVDMANMSQALIDRHFPYVTDPNLKSDDKDSNDKLQDKN